MRETTRAGPWRATVRWTGVMGLVLAPVLPVSSSACGDSGPVGLHPGPGDRDPGARDTASAGDDPDNAHPSASFTHRCGDLACDFDASASSDPDGTIVSYAWDFGDGWTATGSTSRHLYLATGRYPVRLVVSDEKGADDSLQLSLNMEIPAVPPPEGKGIWIGHDELGALPTSGPAWDRLLDEAAGSCGTLDLSDQRQDHNVCIMAKALAHARTGEAGYRDDVLAALTTVASYGTVATYDGRALALGRELAAYVIAADLVELPRIDPVLDELFRGALRTLLTTYTHSGPDDLVECHELRPNNWGAHCGATRAAIAAYLGDAEELDRAADVLKGYLGDRAAHDGFSYGGPEDDLSWQCDPDLPVGINPTGCSREGLPLDGSLPDDQRRGGSFTTDPPAENYVWEALQGLLVQAVILHRAGYPVWEWEDRALLRAVRWLHEVVDFPAEGDDTWQSHIVNRYYGTRFPAAVPARPGKNVGWTDWTHAP